MAAFSSWRRIIAATSSFACRIPSGSTWFGDGCPASPQGIGDLQVFPSDGGDPLAVFALPGVGCVEADGAVRDGESVFRVVVPGEEEWDEAGSLGGGFLPDRFHEAAGSDGGGFDEDDGGVCIGDRLHGGAVGGFGFRVSVGFGEVEDLGGDASGAAVAGSGGEDGEIAGGIVELKCF